MRRRQLVVGAVDDPAEREADEVAEQVVRRLGAPPALADAPAGRIHRSSTVVRRDADHFYKYLRTSGAINQNDQATRVNLIEAWLLDQNIFELEVLLSNATEATLMNSTDLARFGLTLADVVAHLRTLGAPPESASADVRIAFLNTFITHAPTRVTADASRRSVGAGSGAKSTLDWRGLTAWGAGTGVTLTMQPGGIPAGSGPKSDPAWIKTIDMHVAPSGATTIFARGHLLNHNIGGPGLDYNMVPLTGPSATKAGGNNANKAHELGIERTAISTWKDVKSGAVARAEYRVDSVYGRPRRAATLRVMAHAQGMKDFFGSVLTGVLSDVAKLTDGELAGKLVAEAGTADILKIGNRDITRQEAERLLAASRKHALGQLTIPALALVNQNAATYLTTNLDPGIVQASLQGRDMNSVSLIDLEGALTANAAVWQYEEQFVPAQLLASLQVWQVDGTTTGPQSFTVPIDLPTDPTMVWLRPMTNQEIKMMNSG